MTFNSYGMKYIKQYKQPIKKVNTSSQKSDMKKIAFPKTQQIFNNSKATTAFKSRPMSTMSATNDKPQPSVQSWLSRNLTWLKSKFFRSPTTQPSTQVSFAQLYFNTVKNETTTSSHDQSAASSIMARKRTKIKQQFLPVVQALEQGNTNFESTHIKLHELEKNKLYKVSYYDGDEEIGFQEYDVQECYLSNIHIKKEYRGYGIGKFLIIAALAHLKSRGINRVWLMRGTGENFSAAQGLHRLFESLGFKAWYPGSNIYQLYLKGDPNPGYIPKKPFSYVPDEEKYVHIEPLAT
jgi:ribosomal protein S18 acetylase RimI-like enzyme